MPGPPPIDVALATHIQEALIELEDEGKPFFGKRKITHFLQGKSNSTNLELELYKLSYWGTLPFISVRNLQSLIQGMIDDNLIEELSSPRIGKPVLRAVREHTASRSWIKKTFSLEDQIILSLDDSDIMLFKRLRISRSDLAFTEKPKWPFYKVHITRLVSDKILMKIAKIRPKNESELTEIIGPKLMREEYSKFLKIINEFNSESFKV